MVSPLPSDSTPPAPQRPWRDPPADGGLADLKHYIESGEMGRREQSFRRGFEHGAEEVLRLIAAGFTIDQINRWLNLVHRWRWRKVQSTLPPTMTDAMREGGQ